MNKEEYISKLYEYTKKRGIRIYDYYKSLAVHCRKYKKFEIIGFEAFNPFLTPEDYKKLLESSDELMPEFFARVMVKVISLNDIIIAEEKKKREAEKELKYDDIKELINEEYEKVESQNRGLMIIEPKTTALVPVVKKAGEPKKDVLSREEIQKIIEDGFYKDDKRESTIPQEIIEQYIKQNNNQQTALVPVNTEQTQNIEEPKKDVLSREEIQKIIEAGFYQKDKHPTIPQEILQQYIEEKKNTQTISESVQSEEAVKTEEQAKKEAPVKVVEPPKKAKKGAKKSSVLDRIMNKNGAKNKVASVLEKLTKGAGTQEEVKDTTPVVTEPKMILPQISEIKALPPRPEYKALMPARPITREEIEDSISQAMTNIATTEEVKEQPKKKNLFGFLSINVDIIKKLKGFALIRESKTGKANLYYHDPNTRVLKGKVNADNISADTGYYVNYQEYIYKMIDNTMKKYPNIAKMILINEQGEERSLTEVVEEVFRKLREAGAIRFGDEYATAKINSYADLEGIKPGYGTIANEKLKKGIYVRRDILKSEFKKYKMRFTLKQVQDEDSDITIYKKTK